VTHRCAQAQIAVERVERLAVLESTIAGRIAAVVDRRRVRAKR
jgi:hypothetical protein